MLFKITNDARGSSFKCFHLRSSEEKLQLWCTSLTFTIWYISGCNSSEIKYAHKYRNTAEGNVKYKYKRTGRQGRPKVRRIGGMFALHVISSPTDQCSRLFFTNIINTNTKLHLLVSSLFMQIYLCILHPTYSEHYFCTFTFVLIDDSSCYEDMQCILCIRIPSS